MLRQVNPRPNPNPDPSANPNPSPNPNLNPNPNPNPNPTPNASPGGGHPAPRGPTSLGRWHARQVTRLARTPPDVLCRCDGGPPVGPSAD